jgi:hypothetical protein
MENKQTLEEAAQNYLNIVADGKRTTGYADEDFKAGAKWQVEQIDKTRIFTASDLRLAYIQGFNRGLHNDPTHLEEYIELAKKHKQQDK